MPSRARHSLPAECCAASWKSGDRRTIWAGFPNDNFGLVTCPSYRTDPRPMRRQAANGLHNLKQSSTVSRTPHTVLMAFIPGTLTLHRYPNCLYGPPGMIVGLSRTLFPSVWGRQRSVVTTGRQQENIARHVSSSALSTTENLFGYLALPCRPGSNLRPIIMVIP